MALLPTLAAANITSAYTTMSSVSFDGDVIYNPYGTIVHPTLPNNFAADFANAYDDYTKLGIVLGAINSGGSKSILQSSIAALNNSTNNRDAVGDALASYWATVAITAGIPAHGGVQVVSVTNNAASKAGAFKSAIVSSITTTKSVPFYLQFINNIENVVKTIQWSVTEMMPNGSPSVFIETIT